jgi:hypothetical protein
MLLLTSTSDALQVVTGQAVAVDVHASWMAAVLRDVRPDVVMDNLVDQTLGYAVLSPELFHGRAARSVGCSNFAHGRLGQFRRTTALTSGVLLGQPPFPVPITSVTLWVALMCVPPLPNSVGCVVGLRSQPEVLDVHARGVVAAVEDVQAVRDRAVRQHVSETVSPDRRAAHMELAIPARGRRRSRPHMTSARSVDLRLEAGAVAIIPVHRGPSSVVSRPRLLPQRGGNCLPNYNRCASPRGFPCFS